MKGRVAVTDGEPIEERIAVIGLGYVGLPVALAFARRFERTVGFDVSEARVAALRAHRDWTGEADSDELRSTTLQLTTDPTHMADCTFFIVAVPTPLDHERKPDLGPLLSAARTVGKVLRRGAVVVFESTVYPGVTEELCGPALADASGLVQSVDFKLGYSPERINPGDKLHTFAKIVKVVSGEDDETLERVAGTYQAVVDAGVHRAPSIKVAEAAKVIENTQRDVNIALMNELSLIFDRLDIRTHDVLEAAGTKWNFLKFTPGLVGGHCIGVDPYYLTTKAESLGYRPEVILAGRRINDGMGAFVAEKTVELLRDRRGTHEGARVGVLGLTFKENVPDLRNSRVPDIAAQLAARGLGAIVHDPLASAREAREEYGIELSPFEEVAGLDALIVAVAHRQYLEETERMFAAVNEGGVVVDVKSVLDPSSVPSTLRYWSL